jgi:hypothetical protein
MRLRRHATSRAGERESRSESLSRDYQEILRVETAIRRKDRLVGISGMLHRTTVRDGDLIDGTADSSTKWTITASILIPQKSMKAGKVRNLKQQSGRTKTKCFRIRQDELDFDETQFWKDPANLATASQQVRTC